MPLINLIMSVCGLSFIKNNDLLCNIVHTNTILIINLPLCHTTHIGNLPSTRPTSKLSCRRHTWSCLASYLPSSDVGGGRETAPCLGCRWHSPYSQQQQNPGIPHAQSTHKLKKNEIIWHETRLNTTFY